MSRKIPSATRDQAFRLWLQGESYRRICAETGISMGALSAHINELRKRVPDLDQLRELSVVLRKGGSTVFDALRGGRLLDKVGRLGVSLDELEDYVRLTERISHEGEAEVGRFVESALKLMDLEDETGKTHGEITKDFEEKLSEIKRLEMKKDGLEKEIQGLREEFTQAKTDLSSTLQRLRRARDTQGRLKKLGLERLNSLAEFVDSYESLGFSAEEVQRLAEWRKGLTGMDIDPDGLDRFVREKGPLEAQISKLIDRSKDEGRKLGSLRAEVKRLWDVRETLQGRISRLTKLNDILEKGKTTIACKLCGVEAVLVDVPNRLVARDAMTRGLVWNLRCAHCGQWGQYSAWDVLANIGWLALP